MDKLLIVGASGLVGSRLAEIAKDEYEVFGAYNKNEVNGRNFFKLDSTERNDTFRLIEKIKPDFVVDTHSITNLDYCETHPEETWQVNVDGSRNIAEACKNFGSKYIFLSTDYVFDGKKLRYTEKDKPHPLNYYAKTKVIVEHMLSAFDMNYVVTRASVIYGKDGRSRMNFVTWLISRLKSGENVKIVSDQKNNPTFADNLAKQILMLYEKDELGIFNATGKDCLSRLDFSKEIAKTFNLDEELILSVTTPQLNQIALRPASVNMSTDKLEKATGIKVLGVREGLVMLKKQIGV